MSDELGVNPHALRPRTLGDGSYSNATRSTPLAVHSDGYVPRTRVLSRSSGRAHDLLQRLTAAERQRSRFAVWNLDVRLHCVLSSVRSHEPALGLRVFLRWTACLPARPDARSDLREAPSPACERGNPARRVASDASSFPSKRSVARRDPVRALYISVHTSDGAPSPPDAASVPPRQSRRPFARLAASGPRNFRSQSIAADRRQLVGSRRQSIPSGQSFRATAARDPSHRQTTRGRDLIATPPHAFPAHF